MQMRVGFDGCILRADRAGEMRGIHRYTYELVRALAGRSGVRVSIFSDGPLHPRFLRGMTADVHVFKARKHAWWEQAKLPNKITQAGVDVFHQPAHLGLPWKKSCPYVVTNHGLTEYWVPDLVEHGSLKARLLDRFRRYITLRRADRIIAVSLACKRDLVRFWKVPEEKIVVIYEGVSERFRPAGDRRVLERVRKRYGLERDYILFVGGFDRRKNTERLLEAYARCRAQGTHDLVFVAAKSRGYPRMVRRVQEWGLTGRVRFLGQVVDQLPSLYHAARVFVFPSLHESFGLPVAEAMACGVPVVTSDRAACPEIAGDGALLCDPESPKDIAEKIDAVCSNRALADSLRECATRRARVFSWDKAAEETLAVYHEVREAMRRSALPAPK